MLSINDVKKMRESPENCYSVDGDDLITLIADVY